MTNNLKPKLPSEFDLNNPPILEPYRFQEFPKMLYRDDKNIVVKDSEEEKAYLAKGWSPKPPAPKPEAEEEEEMAALEDTASEEQLQKPASKASGKKTPAPKASETGNE